MTSILEKYAFNDCVAGFPLSEFISGENQKRKMLGGAAADTEDSGTKRFEGLVIPVGVISFSHTYIEPNHTKCNITYKGKDKDTEKHKENDKPADVISDELFDKLFMSVKKPKPKPKSKKQKNNGTKKNKNEMSNNETKRKLSKSD